MTKRVPARGESPYLLRNSGTCKCGPII